MKIRLIMLGKTRREEARSLVDDYVARIRHYAEIEINELRDGGPAALRNSSSTQARRSSCSTPPVNNSPRCNSQNGSPTCATVERASSFFCVAMQKAFQLNFASAPSTKFHSRRLQCRTNSRAWCLPSRFTGLSRFSPGTPIRSRRASATMSV